MGKKKYCETLKPGYYLMDDSYTGLKRCIYATGTTRGNKWIELNVPNPKWMTLMWNCISEYEIERSSYHRENPTGNFELLPSITISN